MFHLSFWQSITAAVVAFTALLPFYRKFVAELTKLIEQVVKLVSELRQLKTPQRKTYRKRRKRKPTARVPSKGKPKTAPVQSRDG